MSFDFIQDEANSILRNKNKKLEEEIQRLKQENVELKKLLEKYENKNE